MQSRQRFEIVSNPFRNPWRTGVLSAAVLVGVVGLVGAVVAGIRYASDERADRVAAESVARRSAAIADCNRFAAQTARDTGKIVKHGVVGGAIGAGVGAAGGAIVDGDDGIGKGAGLGALLGATAGTLHGLSEENRRSEQARAAYADCMARNGY
jgi:hypothetical protein